MPCRRRCRRGLLDRLYVTWLRVFGIEMCQKRTSWDAEQLFRIGENDQRKLEEVDWDEHSAQRRRKKDDTYSSDLFVEFS